MTAASSEWKARLAAARLRAAGALLAARTPAGHWEGELSTSALSTATAVTAFAVSGRHARRGSEESAQLIGNGLRWLADHQNPDGGWGDTTRSFSNISTTTLCWAAFGAASADERFRPTVQAAEQWIGQRAGSLEPASLARAIIARYGRDRTFSVPILTMCALAGRLGTGRSAWEHVLPLPFELAALPHRFFAALRLPVVSYALPALIAIGQARHVHRPSRNPVAFWLRRISRRRTLDVLGRIQPPNGGFLEATPLTSFVTMSLAGSGMVDHPVTQRGLDFLRTSVRPDGSWPIDTNLATWVTTLSIHALGSALPSGAHASLRGWLLGQQYRVEHPYTRAAPGGWAWTNLPGGVPDADDTAGALLALRAAGSPDSATLSAATAGVEWLLGLQNRDGGVPTFCRGWGALPFDRSGADLTAHALRAWLAWMPDLSPGLRLQVQRAAEKAVAYLNRSQHADGSWLPLWFGNQHRVDDENPAYGTARVLPALCAARAVGFPAASEPLKRGVAWLAAAQNGDGSWGQDGRGSGSTEETALALEALAIVPEELLEATPAGMLHRGTEWLVARVENQTWTEPSPIGFYFAKLWYYERLYPMIFAAGALAAVERRSL